MLRPFALRKCGPISMWLAGAASVTSLAHAETEAIRIDYRAPPECPSAAEFRAQVFQRATSARLASDADAAARTFVVSIERRGEGLAGSLVVRESGASGAREVSGAQCGPVATVLALATALAIDPRASGVPDESSAKPAGQAGSAEPAAPAAGSSAVAPESEAPSEAQAFDGGRGWWSAALGPSIESGISPRLSLGGAGQLEWHSAAPGSPLSALGVELGWLEAPAYGVKSASSSFRLLLARPVLCSFELPRASTVSVSPCLGFELGAVTGSGADLPAPSSETRVWAAADALLRGRLQASDAWFVELDFALVLPFTRYNFLFREPDTQIYRVPSLAFSAGARLGARL